MSQHLSSRVIRGALALVIVLAALPVPSVAWAAPAARAGKGIAVVAAPLPAQKCGTIWGTTWCVRATIDKYGVVRVGLKLPGISWMDMTVKGNGCYTFLQSGVCISNWKSQGTKVPPKWVCSFNWYAKIYIPVYGTKKTDTYSFVLTFP